jgi:hypothetical protein
MLVRQDYYTIFSGYAGQVVAEVSPLFAPFSGILFGVIKDSFLSLGLHLLRH